MKIGILPKEYGIANEGKWYIGVQIFKYHPSRYYPGFAFRPYFVFMFTKIIHFGTEYKEINGTSQKKIGGWWRFEFPIGIHINIELI